jgi:transcriptional regulator of acetoin/glycerol metabolism
VSPEVLAVLLSHDYPGNVRELHNIIEHAVVLCQGSMIREEHLPRYLQGQANESAGKTGRLVDCERQAILNALRENHWNRLAASKQLGIHKTTLFRKIRKLNIELPDTDGRSSRTE